ncbi:MAG: GatB/YqeY domain-containing protein [Bacteroidales bacterium]
MALETRINEAIKEAMKERHQQKLNALRAVKSAILLAKTEKGGHQELTEEQEFALLNRLAKQRRDSAELYKKEGRQDLYEEEWFQYQIIETFLPAQLTDEEIEQKLSEIISRLGASSMKDMGKVMGTATKEMAGKADNARIAALVKKLLNK